MASIDQQKIRSGDQSDGLAWLGLRLRPPGGPKQKALAAAAGVALLLGGFIADEALDKISDAIFPDAAVIRAEALQNNIAKKVDNIESLSGKITSQLVGMDAKASAAIQRDTAELMLAIQNLRPELRAVESMSAGTLRRFADAKQRELTSAGYSTDPDFVVPDGGGATVCRDGYVFGAKRVDTTAGPRVQLNLAGPAGKSNPVHAESGEGISVDTGNGLVQVVLQDSNVDGSGMLGFSVNCP
ncbi:hypothetical protein E4191_07675 [Paracoccus liaowanqingii]|uniref:Uncharacterized protein n=1 Tax=Paracoccus liaowanqingii TaxID=2560053 RepID=A0A4P7HLU3_9RHOB|nr:hypothetical protein [Paracoccus liaowanqingii]QBX34603.1 hypothetical protein E4191_07675 [Paracoccus liaowanqingii]